MGQRPTAAPTETSRAVVAYLDAMRRDRGVTQAALAMELGISQPQVSQVIRGEKDMTLGVFLKWCAALGLDPSAVVERNS